jgi:hypothetical protein
MSSAYAFAEGGEATDELILGWAIDKYGAQAVYGRTLSFHEIRMLDLADNVVRAYKERERSDNWAEWAENNKSKSRILAQAGKLYDEQENE